MCGSGATASPSNHAVAPFILVWHSGVGVIATILFPQSLNPTLNASCANFISEIAHVTRAITIAEHQRVSLMRVVIRENGVFILLRSEGK